MRSVAPSAVLLAFAAAALVGCTPVYNVKDAPIVTAGGAPASLTDIQRAIERAGAAFGWRMHPVRPGLIVATLQTRSYTAVVDITYDANAYSITYNNSANLNYDGTNIHRTYNGWVQNLDRVIRVQLQYLQAAAPPAR
ncbi:MAG TPA: hypothetical protein VJM14_17415 [Burkholderiales bacterium]|nr:hypothetical protein [Burkholderiales bacterium]